MTSEVVENTGESSFGEAQGYYNQNSADEKENPGGSRFNVRRGIDWRAF